MPLALAGCDAGEPTNQPEGVGAPVHFVANVGPDQPLPENGAIELTFDRLLMPASISRQTFQLSTLTSTGYQATTPAPTVGYDPVSRVVTIAPAAGTLAVGQTYQLVVIPLQLGVTYMQPEQAFIGVVAIDGATLDLTESDSGINGVQLAFQVTGAATQLGVLTVDYCSQINTIFKSCASGVSSCHSPPSVGMPPAQGLVLTEPTGVLATAIGQVAVEANTGPRPITQSPNVIFGLDMPVIDRGPGGGAAGNPSDSWLMYKVLMAVPPAGEAPVAGPGGADIVPLSSTERATLASLVPGREMPFPGNPTSTPGPGLTIAELETLSTWIAQGATVHTPCP